MIYTFVKTKSDKKGIIFKTPKSLNYDKKGRKSLPPPPPLGGERKL